MQAASAASQASEVTAAFPDPSPETSMVKVAPSQPLLAGLQVNALWLLPAIAAIGIAAVVIRRIH